MVVVEEEPLKPSCLPLLPAVEEAESSWLPFLKLLEY